MLDEVERAVGLANDAVEQAGWQEEVFAHCVLNAPEGPVTLMRRAAAEESIELSLTTFAQALQHADLAGASSPHANATPQRGSPARRPGES